LETPTDRPVVEAAVGHLVRQPGFVMLTDGYR
jgi:hypothetical protein